MSLFDNMPTVEEMMAALNSPTDPAEEASTPESQATDMEMSSDEMIRMMFEKVMTPAGQ